MQHFEAILKKEKSSLMWHYRIEVPLEICNKLYPPSSKEAKRVICNINSTIKTQIALTPDGNGHFYLVINKENRKQLGLDIGDKVSIEIEKEKSEYGIALPVEMEELLAQDKEGSYYFHKLTPGKQRTLLHIVSKPKSEQIRIRKSVVILGYLKSVNGKLDFKELNLALKNWNK